jgi:hypothetical protein
MKKTFSWIISIIIVALAFAVAFWIFYSKKVSNYNNYLNYDTVGNRKPFTISINAFLESITEENDQECLNLVTINNEFADFKVCEDNEVVKWDNPYKDYTQLIPVNVVITFSKNIFKIYSTELVKVNLLEDEDYIYFFDLNKGKDSNIHVRIKSTEDVKRNGYYLTGTTPSGEKLFLALSENVIDEIELDTDELTIYFTSVIEGQNIKLKTITKDFEYYEKIDFEFNKKNITKDNIEILQNDDKYQFTFYLTQDFKLEGYINKLLSSTTEYFLVDLNLLSITDV